MTQFTPIPRLRALDRARNSEPAIPPNFTERQAWTAVLRLERALRRLIHENHELRGQGHDPARTKLLAGIGEALIEFKERVRR